jgi:hypothetical protein
VSMSADAEMLIHLPPSYEAEMKSIIGAAGRTDAETKLAEILGRKVKVILEISEGLTEAPSEEPIPEAPPEAIPEEAPPPPAPEPVVPAVDPMEEFKNDPLIKKALEIFAGEIQVTAK